MEFTLKKYQKLIKTINQKGISIFTVRKWIVEKPINGILLRHDVDRCPKNALEMAKLESACGVAATYYFRITSNSFVPHIIKGIHNLGHEIGYHYEDLSLAKGNFKKAEDLFKKHLVKLRQIVPINTIAMHGRPLSRIDNKNLWEKLDWRRYNILGEAFLSIDYKNFFYFTDTGRSWSKKSLNIRDKVKSDKISYVNSTNQLINFVNKTENEAISIVCHPERWNNNFFKWIIYWGFDILANTIK